MSEGVDEHENDGSVDRRRRRRTSEKEGCWGFLSRYEREGIRKEKGVGVKGSRAMNRREKKVEGEAVPREWHVTGGQIRILYFFSSSSSV